MTRRRSGALATSLLFAILSGCGHSRPYYRADVAHWSAPEVAEAGLVTRLVFIGDAGSAVPGDPVLVTMSEWIRRSPGQTTVLFLGDNVYPDGLPAPDDPERSAYELPLLAQLGTLDGTDALGVFLLGNHDWRADVRHQEEFLDRRSPVLPGLWPPAGQPGPAVIDHEGVRLILIDTAWWTTREEQTADDAEAKRAFLSEYSALIMGAGKRRVVVAGHHPMSTHGPHGGFFDWRDHIFPLVNLADWLYLPLPGIGSLYPLGRWSLLNVNEDLNGRRYRELDSALRSVAPPESKRPLLYVAGHEHSLQLLEGGPVSRYLAVSGAGSKSELTSVGHGDETMFAHCGSTGFMAVDFLAGGGVLLRVIEPGSAGVVFAWTLSESDLPP